MKKEILSNSSSNITLQLKELTEYLNRYRDKYEDVNVKISQKLPEIESRITCNMDSFNTLKESVDTERDSKNIHHEMDQFNTQLSIVIQTLTESNNIDKRIFKDLKETITILHNSFEKIENIEHISENLKVFAINSIVYSQHAGHKGKGYQFISEEFIKLSEELSKSTTKIGNLGESIKSQLGSFLNKVDENQIFTHNHIEQLTAESRIIVDESNRSIKNLTALLDGCVSHLEKVKEPSARIMTKLQNQDIIQQEIEHMHETLTDMIYILEANEEIINGDPGESEELYDLLTVINFLIVTTQKQLDRIGYSVIEMIDDIEESLNNILDTISSIKDNIAGGSKCTEALNIIKQIFSKPLEIIESINDKLDISANQKSIIIDEFKEINKLMAGESRIAGDFIPLMDLIKNLLFLAHVEQERNNLGSVIQGNENTFSAKVFLEMESIVNGIKRSQEMICENLEDVISIFSQQEKSHRDINENLESSIIFLKHTEELFNKNYVDNNQILNTLAEEVREYKVLFAKLRDLNNNLNSKMSIYTRLRASIEELTGEGGSFKNLNECKYRDTIIAKVVDNLTVDEERILILEEFPELDIERTTGASITLF